MPKAVSDDVVSILEYFKELDDPRSSINRKHLLGDLIVICVLAVIAGADGPKAIGVWADSNETWLKQRLKLPNGVPSHDTIGRVLATLNAEAFQSCFESWITGMKERAGSAPTTIAIDGKVLRRSHDRRRGLRPLQIVSAWSVEGGMSLGQMACEDESNEITAIPRLLGKIDVRKTTVTIDAAGCQREIASRIVDGGGDYLLALKGNQESLRNAVEEYITTHMENDFADVAHRKHEERKRSHGRVDHLTYYQLPAPKTLPGRSEWKKLKTIGVAIRISESQGRQSADTRYYISSMPMSVKRFANSVRGHWAIENTLHWCLDVTFREDESRVRDRLAATNLAWLKRFAISILKRQTDKESIAMRRRKAGWNPEYLAKSIGLTTT